MSKSELIEPVFTYADMDKDTEAKLRYCAKEVNKLKATLATSAMSIGEMLCIAHDQLAKHKSGTFLKWVEAECGFSQRSVYNYMQAFRVFGNVATVARIEDGALYALAQNDTPEKALKEVLKLADKGVNVTQKQAKEIIKKHKEVGATPRSGGGGSAQPAAPAAPVAQPAPPSKEEQVKTERKKARGYAEYLVRAIDDLNRIKRNSTLHPELLKACSVILEGLDKW